MTNREAERYGPQWKAIDALVRRAATLTAGDVRRLATTQQAVWGDAPDADRVATRDAALSARDAERGAWDTALAAALVNTRVAAGNAARVATRDAVQNAAGALAIRDLIGCGYFTQSDYDTLTGPWARVIGPAHPDDTDRSNR